VLRFCLFFSITQKYFLLLIFYHQGLNFYFFLKFAPDFQCTILYLPLFIISFIYFGRRIKFSIAALSISYQRVGGREYAGAATAVAH